MIFVFLTLDGNLEVKINYVNVIFNGNTLQSTAFNILRTDYLNVSTAPITSNWTYTENTSDSNLANATELYVSVKIDNINSVPVYIKCPSNSMISSNSNKQYNFYFYRDSVVNGAFIQWLANSIMALDMSNNSLDIEYIWYK